MEIKYRSAKSDDIDAICDLARCATQNMEHHNIFQWDSLYPSRDDFWADIQKEELFIGLLNGEIAVIYTLNQECEEEYETGAWKHPNGEYRVIHRFCVHPKYQNQGIAHNTLMHIENELKAQRIDSIRLDVFSGNPFALQLYKSSGFEKVGFADWRKGRFFLMEKNL